MGTGWRRAFCTTIPRDREAISTDKPRVHNNDINSTNTPAMRPKLGFFSSISNPSTPRSGSGSQQVPAAATTITTSSPSLIRCRTADIPAAQSADNTPRLLKCNVSSSEKKSSSSSSKKSSPRKRRTKTKSFSNPASPRSPFSILKNSLRLSKNGCGVCSQSVKTGHGMAIYTAECSHTFHFPCISRHVRREGSLICPVCHVTWKDVPLLSAHKSSSSSSSSSFIVPPPQPQDVDLVVEKTITVSSTTTTPKSLSLEDKKKIQSSIPTVKTRRDLNPSSDETYNDDESLLLSPTAGARFNPIPEAEDEDDDVEEFKGFFVNQNPSAPTTPTKKIPAPPCFNTRTNRNVEVKLIPQAAVISAGGGRSHHETFAVALRVKAPPPPPPSAHGCPTAATLLSPSHRAPIDLVVVLDAGERMAWPKLQMMRRAMRLLVSSLGSTDRLSIVAFAASPPQRHLPLRRMTPQGQRVARRIVDQLCNGHGNGKCLSEALRMAAKVLEDRRDKNPVASIILLSDGQGDESSSSSSSQNDDVRQGRQSSSSASTRFGHIEIPVHSLGGSSMADSFAKQVGGLLSVVVQDLRVEIDFASGSAPGEIAAVYSCNGRPTLLSCDSIRLGDLYAEEERELLLELRVPPLGSHYSHSHHVLSVRCSYKDPCTQEVMYGRERALLVPRPHAVKSSDPRIERMRIVFISTRAVAESRRLVDHGEFGSAQQLLMSARALLAQSSSASADEYVKWLEGEIMEVHCRKRQQEQEQEASLLLKRRAADSMPAMAASHAHSSANFNYTYTVDENGEPLTPTSAWRAAERLAKVAIMKKSLNRSSDLHGFENARF